MKKIKNFSNYYVDKKGNVYDKQKKKIKPFNSNGYYQVLMFSDDDHKRHVFGVHQVVAMAYLQYYKGCVVHHIDGDKHNNNVSNLEVKSVSEHARHHADPTNILNWIHEHGSPTKGMKMSDEFRQHCREAALRRWNKADTK